ncbi:MAG: putative peptide zinc metalloprotease protein [Lentimonas sp.]|jgi:putative peptide zinc metalloprotease protein
MERKLFSESWHRVAAQKIRLRPSVRVRKQFFRGGTWFIANDLYGDQYFRFRPEAWAFIARLDGTKTVEEVWQTCLDRDGDAAPGQGEAIQILSSLYQSNLIVSDFPSDVVQLFERQKKRHAREWKARLFGIFFLRIPLFDPDAFLNRTMRYVQPFLSIFGAILWLGLVVSAIGVAVSNWDALFERGQGALSPSNLPLLLVAFVLAKLVHEFGHGYAVKRFGGEVHVMGITFLVFTPIPYVDATAAWAFRERWKRIWVGSAGMIVELVIAALATFVWASTGPGLLNSWCFNLMLVASVSTILFNINPLLKFDGYYILSDLTDSPNLQTRGMQEMGHLVERYAFGGKHSHSPAGSRADAVWLTGFGIASWLFRVYITYIIIMFVADRYLGLGFLAAVLTVIGLIVLPLHKGIKFLVSEPRIERVRTRAYLVTATVLGLAFLLLGVLPAPRYFRAPGISFAENAEFIVARSSGAVAAFEAVPSSAIAGTTMLRLNNPELPLMRRQLEAEREQLAAVERLQMAQEGLGREVLRERRRANGIRIDELEEQEAAMEVRVPQDGRLASLQPREHFKRWIQRGEIVGESIPEGAWRFFAVVSQQDVNLLFEQEMKGVSLRFPGNAGEVLEPSDLQIVPGRQEYLPSPALGWPTGGPVRVRDDDPDGIRAAEPFFLVMLDLDASGAPLHHGRVGLARFRVENEPYLRQWYRKMRQILQKRFQL